MYNNNDRIAEELSNYCTDLREQLKDAKATITWVCDSKAEVQKKLATAEETLRTNEVAIAELEDQLKNALTMHEDSLVNHLVTITEAQKELDDLEYKYQGLRQELSDVKTGGAG
jgi:chromosome segregation ATPase